MSELADIIRREIERSGPIPFTRFMELALYYPGLGYYERPAPQTGRQGDFYTSVSVGSVFGELLAFQFREWFAKLRAESVASTSETTSIEGKNDEGLLPTLGRADLQVRPTQRGEQPFVQGAENSLPARSGNGFKIVEAGAHDGRLALDILTWYRQHRPDELEQLEYWLVEPSASRRQWQEATLQGFRDRVKWCESWADLPRRSVRGVIFANELLDAFPVHRIGWDAAKKAWFEWGVGVAGDRFAWTPLSANSSKDAGRGGSSLCPQVPAELLAVLPDRFTIEMAPSAEAWWRQAAAVLAEGFLMTLDYGLSAEQFFAPERAGGTLRGFHKHHQSADVLEAPGDQDLTADVNFSLLQSAGELEGLRTEGFFFQSDFLTRVAEKTWKSPASFGSWTPERIRQFQTLTHPEHLGRRFKVLVQSRTFPQECR